MGAKKNGSSNGNGALGRTGFGQVGRDSAWVGQEVAARDLALRQRDLAKFVGWAFRVCHPSALPNGGR